MYEQTACFVAVQCMVWALVIAVLLLVVLLLVLGLQGLPRELKNLFRVRRSFLQFRLRTLLLGFALVQVAIAVLTWKGESAGSRILACAAVLSFFVWCNWTCLAEASRGAESRRWKHIIRPDRIVEPMEEEQ